MGVAIYVYIHILIYVFKESPLSLEYGVEGYRYVLFKLGFRFFFVNGPAADATEASQP
jgi:hypothetical protein